MTTDPAPSVPPCSCREGLAMLDANMDARDIPIETRQTIIAACPVHGAPPPAPPVPPVPDGLPWSPGRDPREITDEHTAGLIAKMCDRPSTPPPVPDGLP